MSDPLSLPALADLVQQSQYRETVMLVCLVIGCVVMLLRVIIPLFSKSDLEDRRKQATEILTTKDSDGNYVMLSFPRMLRDMIIEMRGINEKLIHLCNHQSSMMNKVNNDNIENKRRLDAIEDEDSVSA